MRRVIKSPCLPHSSGNERAESWGGNAGAVRRAKKRKKIEAQRMECSTTARATNALRGEKEQKKRNRERAPNPATLDDISICKEKEKRASSLNMDSQIVFTMNFPV